MKKRVLSLLVDNTSGVLSRISGLFSRRGYNIDSHDCQERRRIPDITRMTVVVKWRPVDPGSDRQSSWPKLVDVRSISRLWIRKGSVWSVSW